MILADCHRATSGSHQSAHEHSFRFPPCVLIQINVSGVDGGVFASDGLTLGVRNRRCK
jgi:hypothetical protein